MQSLQASLSYKKDDAASDDGEGDSAGGVWCLFVSLLFATFFWPCSRALFIVSRLQQMLPKKQAFTDSQSDLPHTLLLTGTSQTAVLAQRVKDLEQLLRESQALQQSSDKQVWLGVGVSAWVCRRAFYLMPPVLPSVCP